MASSRLLLPLLLLASSSSSSAEYKKTDYVIRPASLNRRGVIGPGRICPEKAYAIGFKVKMQTYTQIEDNTALNAIRLICSDDSEVGSAEGRLGAWTDEIRCQNDGDYVTAVKIKTEEWLGWEEDDLGATDFEALCSSGIRLRHQPLSGWFRDRGKWSQLSRCPPQAPAVCGVKSRLDADPRGGGLAHETPDVKGDEAGLTEVQFKCCQI